MRAVFQARKFDGEKYLTRAESKLSCLYQPSGLSRLHSMYIGRPEYVRHELEKYIGVRKNLNVSGYWSWKTLWIVEFLNLFTYHFTTRCKKNFAWEEYSF